MNTVIKVSLGDCVPVIEKVSVVIEDTQAFLVVSYRQYEKTAIVVPQAAGKIVG